MKGKGILIFLLILVFAIASGLFYVQSQLDNAENSPLKGDSNITVEVIEGDSFNSVLARLNEQGNLDDYNFLRAYLQLNTVTPNIKPGEYVLNSDYTINQIATALEEGVLKPAVFVTLPEGLKYEEKAQVLLNELSDNPNYSNEEFLNIVQNPDSIEFSVEVETFLSEFKPEGADLRGFLYPDTYSIDLDTDTVAVVELMLLNLKNKLDENNITSNSSNPQISNFFEALTLASIVEAEASAWDDRSEIAGVFTNRLEIGMMLESDTTVNFATGKSDPGVTFQDIEKTASNPYNTYRNPGLPPGPINNPRIESILAVLNPANTDFLFFYHTSDGQTFFNTNFSDHNFGVCRDLGC